MSKPISNPVYLVSAPLLAAFIIFLPIDLTLGAKETLAITLWMILWWLHSEMPIAITALIPLLAFPALHILDKSTLSQNYGHRAIFLYLGGAIVSQVVQKYDLHTRLATIITSRASMHFSGLIFSLMLTTALFSMWMSNTVTTIMMMPVAAALLAQRNIDSPDQEALTYLAIAYASSIGGVTTLIGTGTNIVIVGVVHDLLNQDLSFLSWFIYALPLTAMMFMVSWWWLTKNYKAPEVTDKKQPTKLSKLSQSQKRVIGITSMLMLGWLITPLLHQQHLVYIDDTSIVLVAVLVLFILPESAHSTKPLLEWHDLKQIPWGIIFILGAGFSIATAFQASGLSDLIVTKTLSLTGSNTLLVVLLIVVLTTFMTEIMSNVAITALLAPLSIELSQQLDMNPIILISAIAFAASYAFMLPVATPPNAIAMSNQHVTVKRMCKIGFRLNLIGISLIALYTLSMQFLFK